MNPILVNTLKKILVVLKHQLKPMKDFGANMTRKMCYLIKFPRLVIWGSYIKDFHEIHLGRSY